MSVSSGNVTGVDFAATQSPNTISMSAPANGATVSSAFSMSATASASIVAVQFQVDGVNAGPEDSERTLLGLRDRSNGAHTLRAIGRDAGGNTVTSASVNVTVSGGSGTALAINGAQTFQTMDGFGVNINSLSWKNGQLAPALDRLVDEVGAKTWRVVFDMMDWESTNDNADPNTPDWTYYNALYSNAKFQNLWGTLRYLNQKGITSGIMLSFMGRVPPWMGGPRITNTAAMEDEFVETVATLLYYARNTENVQFDLLDPLNEPDWDGFEGPQVDQWQYPRLLQKLSAKLDAMGLGDLQIRRPQHRAVISTGVDTYLPQLFANSVVMSKLDHFGLHNYAGQTGGADARIKGSAYPQKNFWMTELSIPEQIFTMIGQGAAAAQIWDAYDSVYNHAILAGAFYNDGRGSTPPNDAGNLAALMSYNAASGVYTCAAAVLSDADLQVRDAGIDPHRRDRIELEPDGLRLPPPDDGPGDDRRPQHRRLVDHAERFAERCGIGRRAAVLSDEHQQQLQQLHSRRRRGRDRWLVRRHGSGQQLLHADERWAIARCQEDEQRASRSSSCWRWACYIVRGEAGAQSPAGQAAAGTESRTGSCPPSSLSGRRSDRRDADARRQAGRDRRATARAWRRRQDWHPVSALRSDPGSEPYTGRPDRMQSIFEASVIWLSDHGVVSRVRRVCATFQPRW